MEREKGFEPSASSLGSWHSTTELLPLASVFRYFTLLQGLSRLPGQSIPPCNPFRTMGPDRKMDSKRTPKPSSLTARQHQHITTRRQPTPPKPPPRSCWKAAYRRPSARHSS